MLYFHICVFFLSPTVINYHKYPVRSMCSLNVFAKGSRQRCVCYHDNRCVQVGGVTVGDIGEVLTGIDQTFGCARVRHKS